MPDSQNCRRFQSTSSLYYYPIIGVLIFGIFIFFSNIQFSITHLYSCCLYSTKCHGIWKKNGQSRTSRNTSTMRAARTRTRRRWRWKATSTRTCSIIVREVTTNVRCIERVVWPRLVIAFATILIKAEPEANQTDSNEFWFFYV